MPTTTRPHPHDGHQPSRPTGQRWPSLDVLKGLALWALIAHHFHKWAGGDVDARFVGFDHFIVTDLAAPAFGLALGAGAMVVGSRVHAARELGPPVWRWVQILLVGLAIDLATHTGGIRGRGVLPTLAVLGLVITVATAVGLRHPLGWWSVAGACVVVAVPATALRDDSLLALLWGGPFALPVYGVFAATGAAVAAHGIGRPERALPIVRAAVGIVVVGLVALRLGRGVVAPEGVWPPARYPGHLGFTLWGLVACLGIWAVARSALRPGGTLSEALARAGRRTLVVFAAHFAVKAVLRQLHLIGDLDTWRWGLVTWVAVASACALSAIPSPGTRGRNIVT